MKIPILDLKRQYHSIEKEIDEAIKRVLMSGQFILGPEVEAFEKEVAQYIGVKHAIGVASGTDALLISLRSLGIGPGDGVVVPAFTFFATAGAVVNAGATPVFCDIDPKTFNISPRELEKILSHPPRNIKIKAIIPVHLYGQMADMDEIMELAQNYALYVVEDCAQSIGAEYRGKKAGSISHAGCLSFFPSKNLGAYGDGGMIVTNDDRLAERAKMMRVHGAKPKYYHHLVGYNSRLDALQAAILRAKFPYLQKWIKERQGLAERYDKFLKDIDGLVIPYREQDRTHVYHQYTVRINNVKRDNLRDYLAEHEIGTEIYYPKPLHTQPCFHGVGYCRGEFSESERACEEVLSLPMFPELSEEEQIHVAENIRSFLIKIQ